MAADQNGIDRPYSRKPLASAPWLLALAFIIGGAVLIAVRLLS